MYSKILVPLDGSRTAEKVLPYARYLAGKFKIPVELLAVIDIAKMAAHVAAEKARFLDTMIEEGFRHCRSYLTGVATTFPHSQVRRTVERGKAEWVIIEKGAADTTMLIAMATHGRSGLNRFLLGSIAEKVLRGSANPLVLVRATEEATEKGEAAFKSVIVPLDGSELAESILPMVAGVAKKLDLEVILFRAYHIPYNLYEADDGSYTVNYDERMAEVRETAAEYLEKKVAEVKKLGVARVSSMAKEGFAGDEIIAAGRKTPVSLVAMCSHGRSGVKRWVLGSITDAVVRHSTGPIMVARAH